MASVLWAIGAYTYIGPQNQQALVSAVVPVVLGWVLVYGIIGTVQWVREVSSGDVEA